MKVLRLLTEGDKTDLIFVVLGLFDVTCAAPRTLSVVFAPAKPFGSQLLSIKSKF